MSNVDHAATLGDILNIPRIHQTEAPLPMSVRRMTDGLVREWTKTMDMCIQRATELEAAARDLRERAEKLRAGIETIPDEINGCVTFEINARNRANALALVNPTD